MKTHLKKLIADGADINAKNESGLTPLLYICSNPNVYTDEIMNILVSAGARADIYDDITPLGYATDSNNLGAVKALLYNKRMGRPYFNIDVNALNGADQQTALANAIKNNSIEIVNELLNDPDLDVNKLSGSPKYQISPLFLAVIFDNSAIVDRLLHVGSINPNLGHVDSKSTPLHAAVSRCNMPNIRLLLAHPATDPNIVNKFDVSPYFIAVDKCKDAIELLRERLPVVAPLNTEPRTHHGAAAPPIVTNLITLENTPITNYNNSTLVFKAGDSFFARTKESLEKELHDDDHVAFECKLQTHGAPRINDIHTDRKLFILTGGAINYVIPYDHIQRALRTEGAGAAMFEIVGPIREIPFISDYKSVLIEDDKGFKSYNVNIVSGDHCQAGTNKPLYELHPLRLVGGRRRRSRSRQS